MEYDEKTPLDDGTSFHRNEHRKRNSLPLTETTKPSSFLRILEGAMDSLHELKVDEEKSGFPTDMWPEEQSPLDQRLQLPGLQNQASVPVEKDQVTDMGFSPRRRHSLMARVSTRKDSTAHTTIEAQAPSNQFWAHPATLPEDMQLNFNKEAKTSVNLPRIHGNSSVYSSSIRSSKTLHLPLSRMQREEALKQRRCSSVIHSFTGVGRGKNLYAKKQVWGKRNSGMPKNTTKSSWKIMLHSRKEHFFS